MVFRWLQNVYTVRITSLATENFYGILGSNMKRMEWERGSFSHILAREEGVFT